MKASVMDLRYRTKEVLRSLEAGEEIILTHRGTEKGIISPISAPRDRPEDFSKHQAIGMWADSAEPVPDFIHRIRSPRPC